MCSLTLDHLSKQYGDVQALDDVCLSVGDGEFFFLLGPSGCGKSTILRIVAGLEIPDRGRTLFDSRDMTGVPPQDRGIGLVFQNYALWPHMTVYQNVAFGLEIKGVPEQARKAKAGTALEVVRMHEYSGRYPSELSGGQQQRVALARAIAAEPSVVLLDEPLSNLDTRLRHELRQELRRIHRETGVTMIYVTHDQGEAISLGTTIAVMRDGRILQVGKPLDLLRHPADSFVKAFLSGTSLVPATVIDSHDGLVSVRSETAEIVISSPDAFPAGSAAILSIQASILPK